MTNEIRVAKAGKNAFSEDPNDFIFHSKYNTFKILAEGTLLNQTVDADQKTFTVAHGLGFIPTAFAFVQFADGKVALPRSYPYDKTGANGWTGRMVLEMDATNLYFIFDMYVGSYTVDIKYYIFESPIT